MFRIFHARPNDPDRNAEIKEFLEAFEAVFDTDWEYTKSMLGIPDETPEQKAAGDACGMESIPCIAEERTFLHPGVDDDVEDWGNRARLLRAYHKVKDTL